MRVNREEVTKKDLVYYGPRFDIYAEDEFGTIYDLEMQNSDKGDLAERMSMYQASLERNALSAENTARQALNAYFTKQIVSDEFTAQIDQAVRALKQDSKRGAIYMEAKEWVAREVARVRTDSLEKGREDGMNLALTIMATIPKLIKLMKK